MGLHRAPNALGIGMFVFAGPAVTIFSYLILAAYMLSERKSFLQAHERLKGILRIVFLQWPVVELKNVQTLSPIMTMSRKDVLGCLSAGVKLTRARRGCEMRFYVQSLTSCWHLVLR